MSKCFSRARNIRVSAGKILANRDNYYKPLYLIHLMQYKLDCSWLANILISLNACQWLALPSLIFVSLARSFAVMLVGL
jgi:hypothetical protein